MVRVKKRYFVLHVRAEKDIQQQFRPKASITTEGKKTKKLSTAPKPASSAWSFRRALHSTPLTLNEPWLARALRDLVHEMHGDLGLASIRGLRVNYGSSSSGLCVVQCRHGHAHRLLASVLPFLRQISQHASKEERVVAQLVHTAATLRHAYQAMEKYQRHQLQLALAELDPVADASARDELLKQMTQLQENPPSTQLPD